MRGQTYTPSVRKRLSDMQCTGVFVKKPSEFKNCLKSIYASIFFLADTARRRTDARQQISAPPTSMSAPAPLIPPLLVTCASNSVAATHLHLRFRASPRLPRTCTCGIMHLCRSGRAPSRNCSGAVEEPRQRIPLPPRPPPLVPQPSPPLRIPLLQRSHPLVVGASRRDLVEVVLLELCALLGDDLLDQECVLLLASQDTFSRPWTPVRGLGKSCAADPLSGSFRWQLT